MDYNFFKIFDFLGQGWWDGSWREAMNCVFTSSRQIRPIACTADPTHRLGAGILDKGSKSDDQRE